MSNLIQVSGLSIEFSGRRDRVIVVDDVSFEMAPGEVLGLVGESGSGKTLTGLSLMRLVPLPGRISGSIRWKGEDVLRMSPRRLQDLRGGEMAMVFQDPFSSLNPLMPVGEQVAESVRLHQRLRGKAAWNRAIEMLTRVHLPAPDVLAQRYPHQLSGGQRQRVMIAIAFACQPELLIADEPTTALDVTLQVQILALLQELREQFGTAVLLISHDLGVIGAVCRRIMVMYAGRIVETGQAKEVLEQPQHPYTQALLESLPTGDMLPHPIPGQPPEPSNRPSGCAFHPRCPHVFDRCKAEMPVLYDTPSGTQAACFLKAKTP
jgi:peptide/nickel transport system ATP-binding protein